jgi:hypothetical protein
MSSTDMHAPDWYGAWRHDAVHELQAKTEHAKNEFGLGKWERYDYDIDAGILEFSHQGILKVVARIQVVGTTGDASGTWLWAWANDHLPREAIESALATKRFGEEHQIDELTIGSLTDESLSDLGWELTAVAARVTHARGAYCAPSETGAVFFIYDTIALVPDISS